MLTRVYWYGAAWRAHLRWRVEQRGVETIEWVGMAAAVAVLLGAVALFFGGEDGGGAAIGKAIVDALNAMIGRIGNPPEPS